MKTITKEVYYCEHCKKHGLSKSKMEYHEKICYSNPENIRPCYNCQHLGKKEIQICEEYYGQENFRNVDIFYCNKKQCFLYAPQNEIKGNVFDLSDEINNPMPRECDNCYYLEKCTSPISANDIPCRDACIIFKEVTTKEEKK